MNSSLDKTPTSGRDLRFDSLRGLLLVSMTINHLPSPLRLFTDGGFGLFSSAEGFVFISGIVAGMVYGKRLRKSGPEALRATVTHRTNMIYVWHVCALMIALVAVKVIEWTAGFCSWAAPQLFFQNPLLAVVLGSLLLYQPGLFDILPMYCVFVALMPFVLRALEAGRHRWVLGLSFIAWAAVQFSPPIDGAPLYPINVGSFNLFAWQLLFVVGLVIGHARATSTEPAFRFRPWLVALAAGFAFYCFGIQHFQWRPPGPDWLFGVSMNKPCLGALRLCSFAAVSYLVALLGGAYPRLLTWRPFAFLGQHSLAVVAAQSVVVMVLLQFSWLFANQVRISLVTAGCVGLLFAAAALHKKLASKPGSGSGSLRARQTQPVALAPAHDARAA